MKKRAVITVIALFILFSIFIIHSKISKKEPIETVTFKQIASVENLSLISNNFTLKDGNFLIATTRDKSGIKFYLLDTIKENLTKINTIKVDTKGGFLRQTGAVQLNDDKYFAQVCYNFKSTYPQTDLTCSHFIYDYKTNSYKKLNAFKETEFAHSSYYLKDNYMMSILTESTSGKNNSKIILYDFKNDSIKQSSTLKDPMRYTFKKINDNVVMIKSANYKINIYNPIGFYNIKNNLVYVPKYMDKINDKAHLLKNGLFLFNPPNEEIQLYDVEKDEINVIDNNSKYLSSNGDYILYMKDKTPYLYNLQNKTASTFDIEKFNFNSPNLFTFALGEESFLLQDSYGKNYYVLNAKTKNFFKTQLPERFNIFKADETCTELPDGIDIIYSDISNIAYFYNEKEGTIDSSYRFSGFDPIKTFLSNMVLYNKYSNKYLFTYCLIINTINPKFELINKLFPKLVSLYGNLSAYYDISPSPYIDYKTMSIYDLF